MTITLELKTEDAEPILRSHAETAAKYGGWLDYFSRRTANVPGRRWGRDDNFDEVRQEWREKYIAAKRVVESFGVEIEATSEPETMTVNFSYVGGKKKIVNIPGIGKMVNVVGAQPDYKHPHPHYRSDVHAEACRHAAERVVRTWRATLEG